MEGIQRRSELLDKLPGLFDIALIQVGKAFRETALQDKGSTSSKHKIRQVIPKAQDDFHYVIDAIEIDILKARAVLERDLKAVRAKRAEREKLAGATRLREENQKSFEIAAQQSASQPKLGTDLESDGKVANPELSRSEDASMIENPSQTTKAIPSQSGDVSEVQIGSKPIRDQNAMNVTEHHQDASENLGLQAEVEQPAQAETSAEETIVPQEVSMSLPIVDGALETPTTANLRDAHFDSMFNDTELAGGTDSIDFLDFSAEGDIGQDLLNENTFGNMTAGTDGFSSLNTTSNEDINTLLPGLDNFVNASDNFMMDIPANTSSSQAQETTKSSADAAGTAPMESSFDDMFDFGSGDIDMGGTDGDMGDDNASIGDFGEFENWFK